eukprot:gene23308-31637_t
MSSRICVKNIGKHTTEKQLKDLFSSKGEVTDVKIIGKRGDDTAGHANYRGLAFIGFRTAIQAEEAQKYFNKSFIGLSKISVELAKRRDETEKKEQTTKSKTAESNDRKRLCKPELQQTKSIPSKQEKKKLEFFEVMKPRHVSKVFNNDDLLLSTEIENKSELEKESDDDDDDDDNSTVDEEKADVDNELSALSDLDYLKSKMKKGLQAKANNKKAKEEEEEDLAVSTKANENVIEPSPSNNLDDPATEDEDEGRLFVKNLPFTCTEEELTSLFASYGPLNSVHITLDKEKKSSKGFGFVQFMIPEHADKALKQLTGSAFQGRLLHIVPAKKAPQRDQSLLSDLTLGDRGRKLSSFQEKKELERRLNFNKKEGWNSTFVRSDAVVDSLAERYGISRSAILDTNESGGDLAVRLAIGESQIIEENREFFRSHGVDVFALESAHSAERARDRSTDTIIVKNLAHDLNGEELESMFARFGSVSQFLVPPSKSMAVVKFFESSEAKAAYRGLAYRSYKHLPLYLEWAPLGLVNDSSKKTQDPNLGSKDLLPAVAEKKAANAEEISEETDDKDYATLFVKNLKFSSSEENLRDHLSRLGVLPVQSGGPVRADGVALSQGYGFIEFINSAAASDALKIIHNSVLDSHSLEVKPSEKRLTTRSAPPSSASASAAAKLKKNSCKLIIRNIAFQANKKELTALFSAFGSLKKVRLPKKMGGEHRGFAFVEFNSALEAEAAKEALKDLHLYGRHLVVEWASSEEDDEDENEDGPAAIASKGAAKLQSLRKRASADMTAIRAQHAVASRAGKKAKIEDMIDSGSFEEAESVESNPIQCERAAPCTTTTTGVFRRKTKQ